MVHAGEKHLFKSEQEYVDAMTKTATVKFLSDDKCVVRGICEMELYTSDKTGKKAVKLEADSLMTETGDYVLMYGMPYYYLTYIPEKKNLLWIGLEALMCWEHILYRMKKIK